MSFCNVLPYYILYPIFCQQCFFSASLCEAKGFFHLWKYNFQDISLHFQHLIFDHNIYCIPEPFPDRIKDFTLLIPGRSKIMNYKYFFIKHSIKTGYIIAIISFGKRDQSSLRINPILKFSDRSFCRKIRMSKFP